LASLVSELVRPHLISIDENEQAALLAAVDAATSDLMRSILHDRKFQALEASWRGLYLLVRRAETGTDLKISIFDMPKDEMSVDLRSQADLNNARIHKLIAGGFEGMAGREAWALVLGDYWYASNVDDIAALIRIGKIAAEAGITFISHVRPDILGVPSLAESADPSSWDLSAASEAGRLWWALRGIPESAHLAMTMPRVLARLPYGRETDPVETFAFEEFGGIPTHDDYLWTNGCFVAGLLLAQTFAAHGWRMSHDFIQNIERLPMHVYDVDGEAVCQQSCEAVLSEHACDLLMGHGLMPIVSFKNSDTARLLRFQSIADPVTSLRGKWQ
jgi:type VI secretion system protein ImpC